MNTNTHGESAKIYQFPVRPRMAVAGREGVIAAAERLPYRVHDAAFGDCWYHDEAIAQSITRTTP